MRVVWPCTGHGWVRENLSAFLDGRLEPAELRRVEAHLASCAACQTELAGIRATAALLRAMPTVGVPRSFVLSAEMAAVARPPVAAARPSLVYGLRNATAAAAALFVAALTVNLVTGPEVVVPLGLQTTASSERAAGVSGRTVEPPKAPLVAPTPAPVTPRAADAPDKTVKQAAAAKPAAAPAGAGPAELPRPAAAPQQVAPPASQQAATGAPVGKAGGRQAEVHSTGQLDEATLAARNLEAPDGPAAPASVVWGLLGLTGLLGGATVAVWLRGR